jgi:hypothetical protein
LSSNAVPEGNASGGNSIVSSEGREEKILTTTYHLGFMPDRTSKRRKELEDATKNDGCLFIYR